MATQFDWGLFRSDESIARRYNQVDDNLAMNVSDEKGLVNIIDQKFAGVSKIHAI